MSKSIPLLILESTSSREKVYRFIQFLIRFLSPIQRSPQLNSIYLLLQKINWNIAITRHINRFGMALSLLTQIKDKFLNKNYKALSVSELLNLGGQICIFIFSLFCNFFYW